MRVIAAISVFCSPLGRPFGLDRAQKPDECAGLITDRKELAALRRK
jgi:hypothetical protein